MKPRTHTEIRQALERGLKALRLPGIRLSYAPLGERARQESLSYEAYLLELVEQEQQERYRNRIPRWLRESHLPSGKTLDAFDRGRLPVQVNHSLSVLLEGGFLDNRDNVLAFGPPGSGKTHMLCALGRELILQQRRIRFYSCNVRVQELLRAQQELRLPRMFKRLDRYHALIIDDLGYVRQSEHERTVLFQLLSHRYERGSVMITSHLAFSDWARIFKDEMTTAAAVDRLVHHSVILELNLPSYRLEIAKKRRKASLNAPLPVESE